jgi:two-component system sensor histidine kinase YesM
MYKKTRTIQSDMFITYSLIIIVVVSVFSVSFDLWGSNMLKSQANTEISNFSTAVSQSVDNQIESMDSVSMNVIYSNLVKQTFYNYILDSQGGSSEDTANELNDTKELTDILMAAIGPNWLVQQINLYDFNGNMFGTGAYNININSSVKNQVWYNQVMIDAGYRYLSLPHEDERISESINANSDENYISLCREYFGQYNDPEGIVEVEQDYNTVFSLLLNENNSVNNYESVYVYNSLGDVIYPLSEISKKDSTNYFRYSNLSHLQSDHITVKNSTTKETELLSYVHSSYTGWTTVVVVSEKTLLTPVYTFTIIILLSALVLIIIALFFSFIAARKITNPILKLRKLVKNIDIDAIPSETLIEINSGYTELEELNLAFHKMNLRIKKSVDETVLSHRNEMQAKMLALQSQMNPHFLYNTLAILSAMAEENMNKQIKEMCIDVSDMLRYISTDAPIIEISNEIQYIYKYISCIKYLLGSKLTFSVVIDKEMNDLKIPKLLIQPLVENAVKHGTQNQPPWIINVKGYIEDNIWKIEVEDNGSGFNTEKLSIINQKINEISKTGLLPSLEIEGMGLLNIFIRLKLIYNNSTIFKITKNAIGGTTVTIGGRVCD